MKNSIRAVQEGNDIAKIALNSDRPWVAYNGVELGNFARNQKFVIKPTVINTGRSPAIKYQGAFGIKIDSPDARVTADNIIQPDFPKSIIMTNQTSIYDVSLPPELVNDLIGAIENESKVIYVVGRLTYQDSNQGRHATSIILRYDAKSNTLRYTAEGNEAN